MADIHTRLEEAEEAAEEATYLAIAILAQGAADTLGPVRDVPTKNRPSKTLLRAIRKAQEVLEGPHQRAADLADEVNNLRRGA